MKPAEQRLLDEVAPGEAPVLVLATATRVDLGQWFRGGQAWVACFPDRVALVAAGKRPHRETIPVAELGKSFYNFLTGELALAPAPAAQLRRLKIAPLEAQKILEQINRKEVSHA